MNSVELNKNLVEKIPKVELHLHLEGAIRRQTIKNHVKKQDPSFHFEENMQWLRDDYRYKDLSDFLKKIKTVPRPLNTQADYKMISHELFEDLANQNVKYVEVSVMQLLVPWKEVIEAINDSRDRIYNSHGLQARIILGCPRELPVSYALEAAKHAVAFKDKGVVGFEFFGDEKAAKISDYQEPIKMVQEAGLGVRIHAGEGAGSESIWEAINSASCKRIAHGVSAEKDPELMDYLRDNKIYLDICPTSNYKLNLYDSIANNPIRKFFDHGIPITVNTDDPLWFGADITEEYFNLVRYFDFTLEELMKITLTSIEGSFLKSSEKDKLKIQIAGEYGQLFIPQHP